MVLSYCTAPRDSATDIEKTSQKGTLEREQPNRSVVKIEVTHKNLYTLLLPHPCPDSN